jgi:hypothetical protein
LKELAGDRFTLITRSKTYVVAEVLVRAGDKSLECKGARTSPEGWKRSDPGPLGAWMAKICQSLRLR